ncbi:hypothetical protein J4426_03075 [Candidatus Woesearchaeota archaeon]|nr:hypothetical protein [Candidatus Woesearchaeota archaeon]
MAKKTRQGPPKCEGRFGELRGLCYLTAREMKDLYDDPLWTVVTNDDLHEFVDMALDPRETVHLYDAQDPYFGNKRDELRGDPLVGNSDNFELALVPFIFEGMRETLKESVDKARELRETVTNIKSREAHLDELSDLTKQPKEWLASTTIGNIIDDYLDPIAGRDFTISQNSVYPTLLERYARLYLEHADVDQLNLIHRGVTSLDAELGWNMHNVMVPLSCNGKKGRKNEYVPLTGYHLSAEFGTGPNTQRTLVSSSPYRLELYKSEAKGHDNLPVLGMNFYLRHPDTMVVSQIQDIRGARVPEGTTDGLCALTIAEKLALNMGFKEILTYTHRNNPITIHYPRDPKLSSILSINFDDAARCLGWEPIRGNNEEIVGYRKDMTVHH